MAPRLANRDRRSRTGRRDNAGGLADRHDMLVSGDALSVDRRWTGTSNLRGFAKPRCPATRANILLDLPHPLYRAYHRPQACRGLRPSGGNRRGPGRAHTAYRDPGRIHRRCAVPECMGRKPGQCRGQPVGSRYFSVSGSLMPLMSGVWMRLIQTYPAVNALAGLRLFGCLPFPALDDFETPCITAAISTPTRLKLIYYILLKDSLWATVMGVIMLTGISIMLLMANGAL
jgi:hypothetical protein